MTGAADGVLRPAGEGDAAGFDGTGNGDELGTGVPAVPKGTAVWATARETVPSNTASRATSRRRNISREFAGRFRVARPRSAPQGPALGAGVLRHQGRREAAQVVAQRRDRDRRGQEGDRYVAQQQRLDPRIRRAPRRHVVRAQCVALRGSIPAYQP